jgi:NAD-dependent deacetylase sirtuin 4
MNYDSCMTLVINCSWILGAGISTESGIPDYRSEGVGLYSRTNHRPMKIQEFLKSADARKRYWARNFIGWTNFSSCRPNEAHRILREWEEKGKVSQIVTQNVDGLHKKAGSSGSIELHGTGWSVVCLQCQHQLDRQDFQRRLEEANPHFTPSNRLSAVRPDGDIHLEEVKDHPCMLS